MINPVNHFQKALDAASRLSLDEQQTLLDILHRRIAEQERLRIAADIAEARKEHEQGGSKAMSVEAIMEEVDREP